MLLVAAVDRRIVPAVRFLARLPDTELRALHIAFDTEMSRQIAHDWMDVGLSWLPLHIHDADSAAPLEASVRRALEDEIVVRPAITVVVPELALSRWWTPLLHRRTARRIAAALRDQRTITTVIVPNSA